MIFIEPSLVTRSTFYPTYRRYRHPRAPWPIVCIGPLFVLFQLSKTRVCVFCAIVCNPPLSEDGATQSSLAEREAFKNKISSNNGACELSKQFYIKKLGLWFFSLSKTQLSLVG